jgi:hypothetical protein
VVLEHFVTPYPVIKSFSVKVHASLQMRPYLAIEEQLGRSIPPRDHVLRHEVLLSGRARQAKVADLEVAVGVQEEVAGLQVAVQDVGGVDVLEAAQQLVEEVLRGEGVSGVKDWVYLHGSETQRGLEGWSMQIHFRASRSM